MKYNFYSIIILMNTNYNLHYFIVISGKKIKIIASSKNKSQAKETINKFITDKIKPDGPIPIIYRITIQKNKNKKSDLNSYNSSLIILLEEIYIKFNKNGFKLKKNVNIDNSNKIYIDKNITITDKIIKHIAKKYFLTEINSFSINKISHFI